MKVKCNKPCSDKATCGHFKAHTKNSDCKSGCHTGAKCVPVLSEKVGTISDKPTTKSITDERGANYGHPLHHFPVTRNMSNTWLVARYRALERCAHALGDDQEQAVRHAVYMICDKLARAATNPTHQDNWDDIQGYARTAKMALGMEI